MRARAAAILRGIGSDLDPDTRLRDLGIASKHLVAIARALSVDARVVIMDEPTAALSHKEIAELYDLVETLKAQGKAAPGGARGYVKNGRMTEGFALIGWPAHQGETGLMTFMVNQDGVVYQKYLGKNTAAIVGAMTHFDPDAGWMALPAP